MTPVALPSLDELVANPARAKDLPDEVVAELHTRCLLALNALWNRNLEARARVGPVGPKVADALLTVEDASRRLRKSRDWLYRHSRELPFTVRVGRQLRFSEQGIERFIRERSGIA